LRAPASFDANLNNQSGIFYNAANAKLATGVSSA
jgi:hypothetical protein